MLTRGGKHLRYLKTRVCKYLRLEKKKKNWGKETFVSCSTKLHLQTSPKKSPENKLSFQPSTTLFSHFTFPIWWKAACKSKSNPANVKFALQSPKWQLRGCRAQQWVLWPGHVSCQALWFPCSIMEQLMASGDRQLFMSELRAAPEGVCCEHLVQSTVKYKYYITHGLRSMPGRNWALASVSTECKAALQATPSAFWGTELTKQIQTSGKE